MAAKLTTKEIPPAQWAKRKAAGDEIVRRAQALIGGASVTSEPLTYDRRSSHSYFRDLMRAQRGMDAGGESAARLERHGREVERAHEYRDISRVSGADQFVPPIWLVSEYVAYARAGRAYANLINSQALPPGTDSINIPKVLTGTTVAPQADVTAVSDTDITDANIQARVVTIAGQQDVAVQLLDQSPVNFDEVIFQDLIAAFGTQVDINVLGGNGPASAQVLGVTNTPGIGTITVSGPTVGNFYSAVANAIQTIHTTRFLPPTHIVMHPRRWAWLSAAMDSDQRPLLLPAGQSNFNALGVQDAVVSQQVVGTMQGLPVVTDPNITTTAGGTSGPGNQDVCYVQRSPDLLLFESGIRSRVMPEVSSGVLAVRLQVYGYLAFTAGRYPQSIVEIGGMSAPAF